MKHYYLATLIWLLEIIMFLSVIGIPALMYLRDTKWCFNSPFWYASLFIKQLGKENKDE